MAGKPILHYFDGRARMESIRWLLAAAGVEFEEKFMKTREDLEKLRKDELNRRALGGRVSGNRGDSRRPAARRFPRGLTGSQRPRRGRESARLRRASPAQPAGAHRGARARARGWRTAWPAPARGGSGGGRGAGAARGDAAALRALLRGGRGRRGRRRLELPRLRDGGGGPAGPAQRHYRLPPGPARVRGRPAPASTSNGIIQSRMESV
ncbi:Hypothetical predicted protein [Marmota monax]|uniref:GST N-terminal domain-containing protein n=1 Tax=Marmota monax TaxID=9995 RepID=A0A5E4A2B3_MARMO|nr:hypothetical protein GHT09_011576 [Marmota monax]VTJ50862.1 Hypothetical predicted protein [Marmota monax]